ncbi:MAG: site-specific integrase, partial [Candidatus Nanopelagicales bacterium]|nr:site-specific integrase [Candidatus Nanopelagicales bacterium]
RHVIPVVGDLRPEDTTTREVAAALNVPLGASYRNSLTAAFRKLGRYAVQRGATRVNVAALVPRPPVARSAPREASSDDMARVLKAAEGHRWELAAWLVVLTGLRRGEIPALRWRDVDLATGSLTVCGAMTRSSEGLQRGEPKTKRGNRRVPIPGPLREQIAAHRKRQNAERLAAVYWEDTGYVLTSDVGTPVDPRNLSREWSLWAERAGLADRGMHLGRHFAATELLGSGLASVADVAAQLGHDPGVLLRTYASAVSPSQRAAAEYLAESLGTANGSRS